MFKLRMFALWLWGRYAINVLVALMVWGVVGGLAFLSVDTIPFYLLQSGWFYTLLRIPTYLCSWMDIILIIVLIGVLVYEWAEKQYADYQAFVISGGKIKRKNEDETE